MKTMQELYNEIMKSDELKNGFAEAAKKGEADVEAFVKANGCEATFEEVKAFLQETNEKSKEVSDEELAAVAGGDKSIGSVAGAVTISVLTVFGCIDGVAISSGSIVLGGLEGHELSDINCFNQF